MPPKPRHLEFEEGPLTHASSALQKVHVEAQRAAWSRTDVGQHVAFMAETARQATHVTEMGIRKGWSTRGWLYGLASAHAMDGKRRTFVAYDIRLKPFRDMWPAGFSEVCAQAGVDTHFHEADVLKLPAPIAETCVLYIDTLHVYGQLKRELAMHAPRVTWRIIMHDTTTDDMRGEILRQRAAYESTRRRLLTEEGWDVSETDRGLLPAVREFLEAHHEEWMLLDQWVHNNGLTVLQRRPKGMPVPPKPVAPFQPPTTRPTAGSATRGVLRSVRSIDEDDAATARVRWAEPLTAAQEHPTSQKAAAAPAAVAPAAVSVGSKRPAPVPSNVLRSQWSVPAWTPKPKK